MVQFDMDWRPFRPLIHSHLSLRSEALSEVKRGERCQPALRQLRLRLGELSLRVL
jgi:hypothetical protein